jgi:signal peptidase II
MTQRSSVAPNRRSFWLPVAAFVLVVGVDQLTKTLVLRNIGLSERIDVVGPLSFVRRYNTGVAFSLGNGSALTAWLVTVVVAALLVWVVRTILRGAQPLFALLLAVIAGGGVANQLDRLFRGGGWNKGAVIDFIDVGVFNFAIFNVADMALSVGCGVLAVWTLLGGGPQAPGVGTRDNSGEVRTRENSGEVRTRDNSGEVRAGDNSGEVNQHPAAVDEGKQMAIDTGASVSAATLQGLRSEPSVEDTVRGFPNSLANGLEVDLSPSEQDGAPMLGSTATRNESSTKGR